MSASLPSVPACAPALSCARAAFRSLRASELAYLQSLPASHGMAQFAESLGGVHHVSQCLQVGLLLAGARPSVDFACGASPGWSGEFVRAVVRPWLEGGGAAQRAELEEAGVALDPQF